MPIAPVLLPMSAPSVGVRKWISTLKFKIVLMAVVTGVLSAAGTVHLVLAQTQASLQQLLLDGARQDRESTAALLSGKLRTLKTVLGSVANSLSPEDLQDVARLQSMLSRLPALNAVFDAVVVVGPDAKSLLRLAKGEPQREHSSGSGSVYFRRVLQSDPFLISDPLLEPASQQPTVMFASPVLAPDGKIVGSLVGSLALQSSNLFADLGAERQDDKVTNLVMDRAGRVLAHTQSSRVLGRAADEVGMAPFVQAWQAAGSPIDIAGKAERGADYLVSSAAIPLSDWVLVRLTPEALAFAPLIAARHAAWGAAAVVALVAALCAGGLAWFMTLPISRLKARAERLLLENDAPPTVWPHSTGEIGELARAFEHVVAQRTQRQTEVQALLTQLEAVLEHAEVGIALTRDGQFELVSRHFCHLFRCEKHELVGQPTRMIYASDDAYAKLAARARPAFIEHGAFDGELQLMRRSGQEFWAHMRGRAVVPGDLAQGTIWTIADVTATRERHDRLAYSSSHDSLTGLVNRGAFEVCLEEATAGSAQEPFCALFIDLDRFKQVNDTAGHAAGDALLRDVAQVILAQVRKADIVARLGGDEFAVLLPRCPPAQALQLAQRILAAVSQYRLLWEGHSLGVGSSIGLVCAAGTFATPADVLRAADSACYAAKRAGRNCVVAHGDSLPSPSEQVA